MMLPQLTIDRHTLALISIVGSALDVLGAMYLTYDLLGGEHGPLRTLTRAVTYGTLYGIGYGVVMGPFFGVVCGIAHGITLAWEFSRASRNEPKPGLLMDTCMSAIRALGYVIGASWLFGPKFGITFGVLSTIGQVVAYRFGIRPTFQYKPETRPRITKFLLLTGLNRTIGYTATGYLCSLIAHNHEHALEVGLKAGLAIGAVTVIASIFTPYVEWTAERVPEKSMGVFGVGLILIGFTLQSLQYWAVVLNVNVQ